MLLVNGGLGGLFRFALVCCAGLLFCWELVCRGFIILLVVCRVISVFEFGWWVSCGLVVVNWYDMSLSIFRFGLSMLCVFWLPLLRLVVPICGCFVVDVLCAIFWALIVEFGVVGYSGMYWGVVYVWFSCYTFVGLWFADGL